ncbi:methyltransferase domain protein [bacterium BMS3Abin01]|nr:methyltransferase domain protein [bacterium BMS3Abin01]
MEDIGEEQLRRTLAFDQYCRFATTRDIININRNDQERYRILDVGGRGNLLQNFMPEDDVFYLDPLIDSDDHNYIEGDGCDIPLEDGSFDFVVSSDVFEHIEPSRRKLFLMENLRVARLGVILGAPFYSEEVELAEKNANDSYRLISRGDDHFWLKEHIENGLPRNEEVEDPLRANGYDFQKIPINNLCLWEQMLCSSFILLAADKLDKAKEFNQFYNEQLYPYDHDEGSYRTIYFIKKEKDLKNLSFEKDGVSTSLHLEAIKNNFNLLSQVYLEDKEKYEQLRKDYQEKEILVIKKNEEIEAKQQHLEHLKKELRTSREEIQRIHSSRSWQITRPLRAAGMTVRRLVELANRTRTPGAS